MSDETEKIVGQAKWTAANHTKGWSLSKEDDTVYMVWLEGNPWLWTPSEKPNNEFQQVLLPIKPTESSTPWKPSGINQQKMHNLPSR